MRSKIRKFNGRMPKWPFFVYVLLTIPIDIGVFCILQWSVHTVDPVGNIWKTFEAMWGHKHNLTPIINVLIILLVHSILVLAFNRYWGPTLTLAMAAIAITVFERFKIIVRGETIQPSDITLAKNDMGSMLNFIPEGTSRTLLKAGLAIALVFVVFSIVRMLDGRQHLLSMDANRKKRTIIIRSTTVLVLMLSLVGLAIGLGNTSSPVSKLAVKMGDSPKMWDSVYDAQANGLVLSFTRVAKPKIMDEPAGYSKSKMQEIAKKYKSKADSINLSRGNDLTDETMIMILSESFSDPSRVPGVTLNKDVMKNIREAKKNTPSGLMLSSGYGGGTANLEYMAGTGLSMANFNPSLTSPYQQLVPKGKWTPSWNQLWKSSTALHPYKPSMYSRATDYSKLGYARFYNLVGPDVIQPQEHIDNSPYVSDESAYKALLDQLSSTDDPQYLSLVTMQNHMGYDQWYSNNEIEVTAPDASADEKSKIQTYAKGFEYTDDATKELLDKLDAIDRPINLMFYGDHLPGIYSSATDDPNNSLALHETDWFIWSNKAAKAKHEEAKENRDSLFNDYNAELNKIRTAVDNANKTISDSKNRQDSTDGSKQTDNGSNETADAGSKDEFDSSMVTGLKSTPVRDLTNGSTYTSPNFFMEMMMEYSNSDVSPYLAMLTELRQHVSAMEPPVVSKVQSWAKIPSGQSIYLDSKGNRIDVTRADNDTRELLNDYKLIQYDITAGRGYLKDLGFMDIVDTDKTMVKSVQSYQDKLDELEKQADAVKNKNTNDSNGKTEDSSASNANTAK